MWFQKYMILPHQLGDIVDLGVPLRWDIDAEEGINPPSLEILEAIKEQISDSESRWHNSR